MENNKYISINYDNKEYVYTSNDIKDINIESLDNSNIKDNPMKYLYRMTIRNSLIHNFILYMPNKHILMLNEPIDYFT